MARTNRSVGFLVSFIYFTARAIVFMKQSDMTEAFHLIPSLLASPERSLSKICGSWPHQVSQFECLPQTWTIKSKMLAHKKIKRRKNDGHGVAVLVRRAKEVTRRIEDLRLMTWGGMAGTNRSVWGFLSASSTSQQERSSS